MKYVLGGLASLALLLVVVAAFALAGGYNVAATEGHNGLTRWFLATVMRRSVASRATSVNAPTQFTSEQVAEGFSEFDEMCVTCHGAPGRDRGEVGKGLNPRPPKLAEAAKEWSTAELFWIVKHGVKMTGMPGFRTYAFRRTALGGGGFPEAASADQSGKVHRNETGVGQAP